jgi:hypothetical protein
MPVLRWIVNWLSEVVGSNWPLWVRESVAHVDWRDRRDRVLQLDGLGLTGD